MHFETNNFMLAMLVIKDKRLHRGFALCKFLEKVRVLRNIEKNSEEIKVYRLVFIEKHSSFIGLCGGKGIALCKNFV